jgi:hypothetical protein
MVYKDNGHLLAFQGLDKKVFSRIGFGWLFKRKLEKRS